MITEVRFIRPVNIGSVEHDQWSSKRAATSVHHGRITIERHADKRDGLLVKWRAGDGEGQRLDITVPWSNVAQVSEAPPEVVTAVGTEPAKGKEQKK